MPFPKATGKKRAKYTPQFKFNLAKEAIKTGNLSEISRKYGIGVNLLSAWTKLLDEQGFHVFETTPDQQNNQLKGKIAKLEQMVGKKEVELNLLKNFSDFYQSQDTG
jgi:transposase-like protein